MGAEWGGRERHGTAWGATGARQTQTEARKDKTNPDFPHPQKEFASILQARNVVAKLNELEMLVSEAERRRDEAGLAGQQEPPVP